MKILAIDPGPKQSAFVCWDTEADDFWGLRMGLDFIDKRFTIALGMVELLAVEFPQSYGITAGLSVFSTCYHVGRIVQWIYDQTDFVGETRFYGRPTIKGQIGGRKDSEINASLRMRYGDAKKGSKLEGVKKDIWAALALAVAVAENPNLKHVEL